MKIGFIGLGKMGKNMVLRLLEKGEEVVAWNRSRLPLDEVVSYGATAALSIEDLVNKLNQPRVIWLMLPAGEVTDGFIAKILPLLSPGDLIIDGANSYYKDTLRRYQLISSRKIRFMDIGVSGGPKGARNGACLMIGGDKQDFEELKNLFIKLSAYESFGYFGAIGSGHFTKMVHNGIEYGMMEAIGEGFAILKASNFNLNLVEVARVFNHHSVIQSKLVGWLHSALQDDSNLSDISSIIGATGEGEWTCKTAVEQNIQVPVIEASLKVRQTSKEVDELSLEGFRNKVVSALRGKFGQHRVKKSI